MRFRQTASIVYFLQVFINIHSGFFDEFIRLRQLGVEAKFVTAIICFHWIVSIYKQRLFGGKLQAHWNSFERRIEDPTVVNYSSFVVIKFIYARKYHSLCSNKFIHRLLSNWHWKKLTITKIIHESEYTIYVRRMLSCMCLCILSPFTTSIM